MWFVARWPYAVDDVEKSKNSLHKPSSLPPSPLSSLPPSPSPLPSPPPPPPVSQESGCWGRNKSLYSWQFRTCSRRWLRIDLETMERQTTQPDDHGSHCVHVHLKQQRLHSEPRSSSHSLLFHSLPSFVSIRCRPQIGHWQTRGIFINNAAVAKYTLSVGVRPGDLSDQSIHMVVTQAAAVAVANQGQDVISLCFEPSQPHRVKMMSGETGRADKPLPSEHFLEIGIFSSFFFFFSAGDERNLSPENENVFAGNGK